MKRELSAIFAVLVLTCVVLNACGETLDGVDIAMRDGMVLKADVFLPAGAGPFPVVLSRTPYNRELLGKEGAKFTGRGIAYVVMDVRGRFESGGEYEPFANEARDGEDTLKWVLLQPWCNGRVAGHGGSYLGYTQWALTAGDHEGLVALVPLVTTGDMYRVAYRGGALNLGTTLGWASTMYARDKVDPTGYLLSRRGMNHLPLIRADNKSGHQVDFFDNWIKHSSRDEYWDTMNVLKEPAAKRVPMLLVAGWFDLFQGPQTDDFLAMKKGGAPEVAEKIHLVIGPWDHSGGLISPILHVSEDAKKIESIQHIIDGWYDYWLLDKTEDNPGVDLPAVRLFVMGANRWQDFDTWPPEGTEVQKWYFHSSGGAEDTEGGGTLSPEIPVDELPDIYVYDPGDPTPGRGGTVLGADMGPYDYAETETRPDILSYTSGLFENGFEIIGEVAVVLHASSTACGTDFVGRLLDVTPEGVVIPIAEGIIRTRTMKDGPPHAGEVARLEIDLWGTAYTFLPGHRMRVDVASGAFPHWDRSLNMCDRPFGASKEFVKSTQAVYHDAGRPSHILLPVYKEEN